MRYRYCVITDDAGGADGNLCDALIATDGRVLYIDPPVEAKFQLLPFMGRVKVQVFHKGELLVLCDYGREVCGMGRKPSKWHIGYEVYERIEDAIARAKVVSENDVVPPPAVNPVEVQTQVDAKERTKALVDAINAITPKELGKLPLVKALKKALKKGGRK